jgi:hypothetical protein
LLLCWDMKCEQVTDYSCNHDSVEGHKRTNDCEMKMQKIERKDNGAMIRIANNF